MLTENQNEFIERVIDLAGPMKTIAQYAPQSDGHMQAAVKIYSDHVHQAMILITPLAESSMVELLEEEEAKVLG